MLTDAAALAFGDVYRTALVVASVAWVLVWTLRRVQPAGGPAEPGANQPSDSHESEVRRMREPVLVGE